MRFELVDGGLHLIVQEKVLQALARKAGDADGAHAALAVEALGGAPGGIVVAIGLVQQVEVEIVEPEQAHRAVEGAQGVVVLVVLHPELGGDEEFVALDAAVADGQAHLALVKVGGRRVDEAVARFEGFAHDAFCFLGGHLEHAEAHGRHENAVVEFHVFHVSRFWGLFCCKCTPRRLPRPYAHPAKTYRIRGFSPLSVAQPRVSACAGQEGGLFFAPVPGFHYFCFTKIGCGSDVS